MCICLIYLPIYFAQWKRSYARNFTKYKDKVVLPHAVPLFIDLLSFILKGSAVFLLPFILDHFKIISSLPSRIIFLFWPLLFVHISKTFGFWVEEYSNDSSNMLTLSVVRRVFIFILFIIWRFYTASETLVGIKIVQYSYEPHKRLLMSMKSSHHTKNWW